MPAYCLLARHSSLPPIFLSPLYFYHNPHLLVNGALNFRTILLIGGGSGEKEVENALALNCTDLVQSHFYLLLAE